MSVSPPLRKLQYALAVARQVHFRKAAESVNVSQPTLSRQIRDLEDEIGLQLFQRDCHPVALTAAGQAFIAVVEEMMLKINADFQRAKMLPAMHCEEPPLRSQLAILHSYHPAFGATFDPL
jgi:DNA-binding transcriptional LysR family regulator